MWSAMTSLRMSSGRPARYSGSRPSRTSSFGSWAACPRTRAGFLRLMKLACVSVFPSLLTAVVCADLANIALFGGLPRPLLICTGFRAGMPMILFLRGDCGSSVWFWPRSRRDGDVNCVKPGAVYCSRTSARMSLGREARISGSSWDCAGSAVAAKGMWRDGVEGLSGKAMAGELARGVRAMGVGEESRFWRSNRERMSEGSSASTLGST